MTDIQNVLNLWSTRGLSLLGKIQILKTLGISKIEYVYLMAYVPKKITGELKKLQENLLWKSSTIKIKHSTLIADYKDGRIKKVDKEGKPKALKLTWIRRLCEDNHHPWKIIPTKYLTLPNGDSYFHRNFKSSHLLILK